MIASNKDPNVKMTNEKIESRNNNEDVETRNAIDTILEKESNQNKKESWNKLDKTVKLKKISEYIKKYATEKQLSDAQKNLLSTCLGEAVERKRLSSVKDVVYDMEKGVITNIPNLCFNVNAHRYTLKRTDKKSSTIKSLGSGKTQKKHKNTEN